jgi:hypothetical protein
MFLSPEDFVRRKKRADPKADTVKAD